MLKLDDIEDAVLSLADYVHMSYFVEVVIDIFGNKCPDILLKIQQRQRDIFCFCRHKDGCEKSCLKRKYLFWCQEEYLCRYGRRMYAKCPNVLLKTLALLLERQLQCPDIWSCRQTKKH